MKATDIKKPYDYNVVIAKIMDIIVRMSYVFPHFQQWLKYLLNSYN